MVRLVSPLNPGIVGSPRLCDLDTITKLEAELESLSKDPYVPKEIREFYGNLWRSFKAIREKTNFNSLFGIACLNGYAENVRVLLDEAWTTLETGEERAEHAAKLERTRKDLDRVEGDLDKAKDNSGMFVNVLKQVLSLRESLTYLKFRVEKKEEETNSDGVESDTEDSETENRAPSGRDSDTRSTNAASSSVVPADDDMYSGESDDELTGPRTEAAAPVLSGTTPKNVDSFHQTANSDIGKIKADLYKQYCDIYKNGSQPWYKNPVHSYLSEALSQLSKSK
ncbi:hypothetical protein AGMMS49949_02280 [Alphaproteobacteria bacterium]|nr:hypothetical protein AGMMS49949_02280 [Alphaproteobacteria bacterium]GHS99441.1 hypothetical protein AGMMS50296_7590 [Alphaproteobacteria bacterium]